ncbi:MAG TPA: hypothetical protein VFF76_12280 [Holophagaceae bacterium]|jgi:hypothetical protein|nr:hypothetical protein [Holophagaceae bacterium]
MKRALPWILTCIVAGAAVAGLYSLARRDRASAPAQGPAEAALFTASPAGQGVLFRLQPASDQPLRAVRFLPALADGEVIAQVLTQTGDQLIGRFKDGQFAGTLRLQAPDGVPPAFFRFARLNAAAALDDGSLLLLYGDGTGGSGAPWLVDVDGATQAPRWAMKAAGARIALEPGGHSCLLWDGTTLSRASWTRKPALMSLALPDGVSVLDTVLPMPAGRTFLAHPGGLAIQAGGAWALTPLPDPGELSFPGAAGVLAPRSDAVYWQPRPGQLSRIGADGAITAINLAQLAPPAGHERDLAMLRLAGVDAHGRLWFRLATPDLSVAPHPTQTDPPSAALQATAAMAGDAAVTPTSGTPTPAPFNPAPWMDYLKSGLDRAYVWDPKGSSLRLVDWKAEWPALGAPAGFPLPLPRDMQPQGGALLLGLDTRAWWLPLDKLAP